MLSSWAIDAWHNGLGLQRQNTDLTSNEHRLWDVDGCDTRNPSAIILSPALNTCTIVPSRGDLELELQHINKLYFLNVASGGDIPAIAFNFSPPLTIGSLYRFASVTASTDIAYVGSITAVTAIGANIAFVGRGVPVGGGAVSKLFIIPTLGGTITLDEGACPNVGSGNIMAQIVNTGGTLHVLTYNKDNGFVDFPLTTYPNPVGNSVATTNETIGSYLPPLVTDGLTTYAQLPSGIYDFDDTPAIAVDTSRAKDLNGAQTIFGGNLYFKNKKSVIKYDGTDTLGVGYDREDGLPTEQFGEITAMCSSWKYVFAAIKGASYSHILAMDADNKWQYYARIPTIGLWVKRLFLSDAPDAIDRLWVIFGNYGYPGYFLNPMVAPLQAGTYSWVPTGYFTKPEFDGGMAEESGAFYDMNVTADGIGGSNKITCLYGLNGAAAVSTLGVVSTTSFTHTYGSPYGVEGYRIQPKFMLHGANSGTTPQFKSAVLHYLKIPRTRESFEFTIDLQETAKARRNPLEAVIGSLNSERDKKTLMPFWYGQIGTKAVKVLDMPGLEDIQEDKIYSGEREGFISVQVAEIL